MVGPGIANRCREVKDGRAVRAQWRRSSSRRPVSRTARGRRNPGGRGLLDRGDLAAAGPGDLDGVPADLPPERALARWTCRRPRVHGRARLRATPIGPATLVARRTRRGPAPLADTSLVHNLYGRPRQRLTQDSMQVPLMMLDDQDPAMRRRRIRLRVTRCVGAAGLHRPEPCRQGNSPLTVAPGARLLDGQAVAIEAHPRLSQRKTLWSSDGSGHTHATPPNHGARAGPQREVA
jgi:hypothetical protein